MPRPSTAWVGAEALWVTAAGWSSATKRKLGQAFVVTPDRVAQPEEVIHYPRVNVKSSPRGTKKIKWAPQFLKTFLKDLMLWRQSFNWSIIDQQKWVANEVAFVWQQHDL